MMKISPLYGFVEDPVLTGRIFIALAVVISAVYFVSNIKKRCPVNVSVVRLLRRKQASY